MRPVDQLDLRGLAVLDGGFATELEQRGCDISGPLWSAHVLDSSPQAIEAVHRAYLEAGADCILTASYQVSFEGYRAAGLTDADAEHALREAVAIADRARVAYQVENPRRVWVAASLGPYGGALHNGAEYHGNYDCSFADLVRFHGERIGVLQQTAADFIAFETIPSLEEGLAIVDALHEHPGVPASITFTCRDHTRVAHGEPLRTCAERLAPEPQVIALGVNCTPPSLIAPLLTELAGVTAKPLVVYPNSGESWDAERRCWVGDRDAGSFGQLAQTWRELGAQWIGGCCRTGPDHIRATVSALRGHGLGDLARSSPQGTSMRQ